MDSKKEDGGRRLENFSFANPLLSQQYLFNWAIGNQLWDLVLIAMLKIAKQIIFVNNMARKIEKIIFLGTCDCLRVRTYLRRQ